MNANQLADELDSLFPHINVRDAATMIRQQQAEIEALIKVCTVFEDYLNGPTAWTQEQVDNLNEQVVAILRKAQEK
jgi:hypothetical protein